MSCTRSLEGLYVITDDVLTPASTVLIQVQKAIKGGAKVIQLRDKSSNDDDLLILINSIQNLCNDYDVTFVLNDRIDLAIQCKTDGLHIGKSDHERFAQIRKEYSGIIGVSCYGDIDLAKKMQEMGADYVAFGSFFYSPTKPNSNIVPLDVISQAKQELDIPVCAIGGLNEDTIDEVMEYEPDMIALISDIWQSEDITAQANFYANLY